MAETLLNNVVSRNRESSGEQFVWRIDNRNLHSV